jgi:sulfide dehydrogenase cytochrome subunit
LKSRKIYASIAVIAVWICLIGVAQADIDDNLKMCVGCHGEDGVGIGGDVPIIAGIPAFIQEDALFTYIDGDRKCESQPAMCNVVSNLTENEVFELAEYFGNMLFVPANENFDAVLAEKGKAIHLADCAMCHIGEDPGGAEASILHGQRKDYLRYALQQYATDQRLQLDAMKDKTSELSAEDIDALVNYYASYRE